MAKEEKVDTNTLIIQYITHIDVLKLDSESIDQKIQEVCLNKADELLSITLNGKIIYTQEDIL